LQVVLQVDAQGIMDMDIPALAEDGDGRGSGIEKRLQVGIPIRRILEVPG